MSDARHTPTPWKQNVNDFDMINRIEGPDGTAVLLPDIHVGGCGELVCVLTSEFNSERWDADIAFMQLACNNHDELVAACEACVRSLIDAGRDHVKSVQSARVILAKVEDAP